MDAPTIYFLQQTPPDGPVKIGYTKRKVRTRVGEAQTFSATKLFVLVEVMGTKDHEKALHRAFSHLRIRGEWFSYGGEIRDLVCHLVEGGTLSSWLPQ